MHVLLLVLLSTVLYETMHNEERTENYSNRLVKLSVVQLLVF